MAAIAKRLRPGPTPGSANPCILVVDDEPSFCAVMEEILALYGYRVELATSVREALAILADAIPNLILTDVMMPEIDGLSFIRQLRAEPAWSGISVIVVTAKAAADDLTVALEAGADACLTKPFSAGELRASIESLLDIPQT